MAGLEPDELEPEEPEPEEFEPDEFEPEEFEPDEFEPEAAGADVEVEAGVEDEESDLLSAVAGAADLSALTFAARESLR